MGDDSSVRDTYQSGQPVAAQRPLLVSYIHRLRASPGRRKAVSWSPDELDRFFSALAKHEPRFSFLSLLEALLIPLLNTKYQ